MTGDDYWANDAPRYHHAQPGEGARRKAEELAAGKSNSERFFDIVTGRHTDEVAWRKGAVGEQKVGQRLGKLPRDRWRIVHDLTIGSGGANLDHLVIGPAGVFTLNTKYLSGKITVYERAMLVNGHKTPYLPKAVREAERVQAALTRAVGRPVHVWALIVLVAPEGLTVKHRPDNVSVLRHRDLPNWFLRLPTTRLSPRDVIELEVAARASSTWPSTGTPKRRATAPRPSVSQPPPPAGPRRDLPPPVTAMAAPSIPPPPGFQQRLVLQRWRRFGHDRIYVNTATGKTLGYLDTQTQIVHLEDERDRTRVELALGRPPHPGATR